MASPAAPTASASRNSRRVTVIAPCSLSVVFCRMRYRYSPEVPTFRQMGDGSRGSLFGEYPDGNGKDGRHCHSSSCPELTWIETWSRTEVRGGARCRRSKRSPRGGRSGPGHGIEIEKFQQVGLRGIAGSQLGGASDKAVLHKLDDCRVVHRCVRNIMPTREGRDDHVGQPESKLRGEALHGWCVLCIGSRVVGQQVTMNGRGPAAWHTGEVWDGGIGVDRDLGDVWNCTQ